MSPRAILCILLLAGGACLFPGCLAGTAGVALGIWSAVGGEEGRPEDAPRVVNLRLLPGSEGSPRADDLEAVRVSFDLVSPSGRPARVKVEHSSGRRAATIAEMDLDASPAGRAHVVVWNAAADGLEGLVRTELAVTPRDGAGRGFGARLAGVLIGNDPPQVASVEVEGERVEKNVVVRFELSDSAGDPSRIALLVSQDGGGSFAGVPREHVPVGALERVPPGQHALTWDSEATLGRVDISGVVLAIEPDDGLAGGAGERRESSPFRADNNEPPAAVVNGASFVLNADATRGIPVPFALEDPEGDQVLAVFQWRFASQPGFPELPADRAAMEAALADPALREALQVAAEQPRELEGRLVLPDPADLARVELPEARSGAAALASSGLAGQELEVLRDGTLAVVRPPGGGLAAPVAVASLPGAAALVLDRPSEGSWRLQELDLEASRIARRIAPVEGSRAGLGSPTALALEPGGDSALVALELGKVWWVLRAGLEDGATAVLVDASAAGLLGSVRALAPLGTAAALATVGGALLRIEYAAPGSDGRAPRASVVLDGLASPWGIAVDPLHEGRVYLAERDAAGAGRVLAIDLRTLERRPLAVGGLALERPEALALAGARLLVATDEGGDGLRELRAADLGAGRPEAFELAGGLATGPGGIAAGPDGLVLAALPALGACAAGGGVAQARRICAFDGGSGTASLERPLDPPPRPGARWRARDRANRRPCEPPRDGALPPAGGR
ncbi:MAG: hypothetical protein HY721_31575, partial [Planctomycetes bacterium]|nr:hypothetical protein [Planctomycetota bacterium]